MKKRIVILGAGESGTGAAILAKQKGFTTFVSDYSAVKEQYKQELIEHGITWEENTHTEEEILNADEVIKSPGIPDTAPIIRKLKEKGIPLLSEIEFAARYSKAVMIAITGSNGKTTTTSLLYHLFTTAGKNVGLAGNIGYSLARQVAVSDKEYFIIELSSFQLDNMYDFKADIAMLLNITPDHLDRYDNCMDKYIDSKFRITQNQTLEDAFIYGCDDDTIVNNNKIKNRGEATEYCFGLSKNKNYAYKDSTQLIINSTPRICINTNLLQIKGEHNIYNTLAALSAASIVGIKESTLKKGVETFTGVEHRLEYVTTKKGITYINDSKATNVDSCKYALQSIETKTVLILGGKDKGNDYTKIESIINTNCSGLVFMGVDNSLLIDFFKDSKLPIANTSSMQEAVQAASQIANPGETVLLSPCCASFDLFTSYEHRGELFKKAVKAL